MSYVYQLPIDTAKVDKTCVSAMWTQQEKCSVHQLRIEREVNKTSEWAAYRQSTSGDLYYRRIDRQNVMKRVNPLFRQS